MPNSILKSSLITNEAAIVLENNLAFAKQINRDYDSEFMDKTYKRGDTINLRKPARYLGRSGATAVIEDQTEASVPLVLSKQFGVDIALTSKELTLEIGEFSERIIKPAMARIANEIDADGLGLYNQVHNVVGTPGTTPATALVYLQAGQRLNEEAAPMDSKRSVIINSAANALTVDGLKGLFQSADRISDQYESGNMGQGLGFKFSVSQNVTVHTVGPLGGTPVVNGASQVGSNLVTNGWTAAAALRLRRGDVFTIAGVFAVNPQSRLTTGVLRQFVVTGNVSSDASGNATIPIYPPIQPATSQLATVTASPANGAAITVVGSANAVIPQNMAFHQDAFVLGCAPLDVPKGVHMASRTTDKRTGLSVRMISDYVPTTDTFLTRFDVLYGYSVVYPELACRIVG